MVSDSLSYTPANIPQLTTGASAIISFQFFAFITKGVCLLGSRLKFLNQRTTSLAKLRIPTIILFITRTKPLNNRLTASQIPPQNDIFVSPIAE